MVGNHHFHPFEKTGCWLSGTRHAQPFGGQDWLDILNVTGDNDVYPPPHMQLGLRLGSTCGCFFTYTLPETNSLHLKKQNLEKEIPIGNHHFFRGELLVSGSVITVSVDDDFHLYLLYLGCAFRDEDSFSQSG